MIISILIYVMVSFKSFLLIKADHNVNIELDACGKVSEILMGWVDIHHQMIL